MKDSLVPLTNPEISHSTWPNVPSQWLWTLTRGHNNIIISSSSAHEGWLQIYRTSVVLLPRYQIQINGSDGQMDNSKHIPMNMADCRVKKANYHEWQLSPVAESSRNTQHTHTCAASDEKGWMPSEYTQSRHATHSILENIWLPLTLMENLWLCQT